MLGPNFPTFGRNRAQTVDPKPTFHELLEGAKALKAFIAARPQYRKRVSNVEHRAIDRILAQVSPYNNASVLWPPRWDQRRGEFRKDLTNFVGSAEAHSTSQQAITTPTAEPTLTQGEPQTHLPITPRHPIMSTTGHETGSPSARRAGDLVNHRIMQMMERMEERMTEMQANMDELRKNRNAQGNNNGHVNNRQQTNGNHHAEHEEPEVAQHDSDSEEVSKLDTTWKIEEIGLFHPNMDQHLGKGDIVHQGSKLFFRNVELFIESAENACKAYTNASTIRRNLHKCLRGEAQEWYVDILSPDVRELLRHGTGIEFWKTKLREQFHEPLTKSIQALSARYTVNDFLAHKDPISFITAIVRHAKSAQVPLETQLTWAYIRFDAPLRQHLQRPSARSTLQEFLQDVRNCKNDLWPGIFYQRTSQQQRPSSSGWTRGNPNSIPLGSNARSLDNSNPFRQGPMQQTQQHQSISRNPYQNAYQPQQKQPYGKSGPSNAQSYAQNHRRQPPNQAYHGARSFNQGPPRVVPNGPQSFRPGPKPGGYFGDTQDQNLVDEARYNEEYNDAEGNLEIVDNEGQYWTDQENEPMNLVDYDEAQQPEAYHTRASVIKACKACGQSFSSTKSLHEHLNTEAH